MSDRPRRTIRASEKRAGMFVRWGNFATLVTSLLGCLLAVSLYDNNLAKWILLRLIILSIPLAILSYAFVRIYGLRMLMIKFLLANREKLLKGGGLNPRPDKWTRMYFGILALLEGKRPKLYELQATLPKLPVPPLDQTLDKYLNTVKPLLSDTQFETTTARVNEFRNGVGPQLHKHLCERQQQHPVSWLEEWWEEFAYLRSRVPLVINSNWYGSDRPARFWEHNTLQSRMSGIIYASVQFREMMHRGDLEPLRIAGALPLCMNQYTRLFSTCRVPGIDKDKLVTYERHESRHVIVIRRGQLYRVDVYYGDNTPLTVEEIEHQLNYILAQDNNNEPPIGALTSQNRDIWAKWRTHLIDQNGNGENIHQVESALFVCCIEESEPQSVEESCQTIFYGNVENRWYDKSFQLCVFQNGRLGANVEHTWADAPIVIHLFDYCFGIEDNRPHSPGKIRNLAPPRRLHWEIDSEVKNAISEAIDTHQRVAIDNGVDLHIFDHQHFGKGLIKQAKISPDGFCQMALQLAYYRIHGEFCLTYESAQTRMFLHGRTETVRSASNDSAAFCKSMEDPSTRKQDRLKLLRTATENHVKYMRECMNGQGVDRALLGLQIVAAGSGMNPLPSIFTDDAWQLQYKLSSSQSPGQRTTGGGFGPNAHDGYGISYVVCEDKIIFHITSWKESKVADSRKFAQKLEESLLDIRSVCIADSGMQRSMSKSKLNEE